MNKKPAKTIVNLRLERVDGDGIHQSVDVYPEYDDGSTTLIPEYSFQPMWVTLMKQTKLTDDGQRILREEAIYRGQLLGYVFDHDYIDGTYDCEL